MEKWEGPGRKLNILLMPEHLKIKHNKDHFFKGMIWSSGGNVIAMAAGIVTVSFASRILTKEQLGIYFLVLMMGNFISIVGDFGLRTASVKFLSSALGEEKAHMANILISIRFLHILVVGLLLVPVIVILKKYWSSELFGSVAWFILPFVVFQMMNSVLSAILVGYHRFKLFSIFFVGLGVLRALISILSLLFGYGLDGLMWSLVLSTLCLCVIIWTMLPFKFRLTFDQFRMREILKFGGWVYSSSVISIATVRVADAILVINTGPAILAIYGNAMRIPNLLLRLFESIRPIVLSYTSSQHISSIQTISISVRLLSGLLSVFAAFLIAFGKQITLLLFSEKYLESVPILQVLSFWISISVVNYFLVITLIGTDRVKRMFVVGLVQFIVSTVAYLILIPRYGAMGAAISATLIALVCDIVSMIMVSGRSLKVFMDLILAMSRSAIPLFVFLMIILCAVPSFMITVLMLIGLLIVFRLLKALTFNDLAILFKYTFRTKVS
jgi:O-antigen/teichoic acid export membrane protein